MAFTENLDLFLDPSSFGIEVKIDGVYLNGILDTKYIESGFSGSTKPIFICKSSQVEDVTDGSTLTLASGVIYKIRGPIEPDGTGFATLILELQ